MSVSWDNLTPIDEEKEKEQAQQSVVSWDALEPVNANNSSLQVGSVEYNDYARKNGEIYNAPSLLDKIGQALKWIAQTPFKAYSQGEKNVEAAELNAKEIFHNITPEEKKRMNELESAEHPDFGVPDVKYADENITNLPERAANSIKKGYAESFENLSTSVEVMKEAGWKSAIGGGIGTIGGALWGLRKGNPVGGMLDGFSAGVRLGGGAGAARKSFELEAGFARQELKNMRDKDGKPLPDDLVNNASIGVGIANAGLETIGLAAELKTFPGMDKIFKQAKKDFIKKVAEDETLRNQLLAAGKNLIKSTATEMATESIQQVSNIVAEEYSKKIAGNYDDALFEDGKINQGALRRHIGEVIQAGVSAIGPSMIIGGVGTSMTATNILVKNGMDAVQAKKLAESMPVDERADLINNNLDTLDNIAKDHITDLEAQDIEKNFFDKAIETYKDADGNISAEKENQVFSAAKLLGAFSKKFGSDKQAMKNWVDKIMTTNKPVETLQGEVRMDVPFEELNAEDIPEIHFQKNAEFAGAVDKTEAVDAAKMWKEQKTDSPYFQKWFGDSKVTDDEGKPLVVYHGSNQEFEAFDIDKSKKGAMGKGFYFTPHKNTAENFGNTKAYYLSLKNPFIDDGNNVNLDEEQLKKEGYDGIIADLKDFDYKEIVAFYPEQVKSIYNLGTFSKDTGNIYFQKNKTQVDADVKKLKSDITDIENGKIKSGRLVKVASKPSDVWIKAGLPEGQIYMPSNVYKKITELKHSVDKSVIEKLPVLLTNPKYIFKSATQKGSFVGVLDAVDNAKDKRPVLVALKPTASGNIEFSIITSAYGKDNAKTFIKKQIKVGNLLYQSINKDLSRPHSAPIAEGEINPTNSLNDNGGKVNPTLFKKEFGDSVENIEVMLSEDVQEILDANFVDESEFKFEDIKIYGSYLKGTNKSTSDLDVLVQYSGSMREDDAFNMFADAKIKLQNALGKNVKVDINPINTEKSGTIDEHLEHLDRLENKNNTYYQEKNSDNIEGDWTESKSLDELHKDVAINRKEKELEYFGYFKEGQDKNIIGIMQDANESTLVHEMGHLFLQGLNELSASDETSRNALTEVNEWLGYEGGGYTVEQQEKFAKGFEAYLYKGQAPTSNLREVFERFKDWLKDIYSHITQIADFSDEEFNKIQNVFDNLFSEKSEKQKQVDILVEKTKYVGLEKLSETETRHKDIAYDILSVALGKNKKWLKTILESESENPKILKQKEKIELSLEHVDDKISGSDGFLPEWSEFFRNPSQWGEANDYALALEAYNTIVDKTYKQRLDQLGFLDRTEAQYQYLLNQFKNAVDRDIPLAAFWDWLSNVDTEFQDIYNNKFEKDVTYIERFEKMDKFEQAKETILKAAHEAGQYMSSVEKYQDVVKAAMKSIKFLTPRDQAKLTANILDIPSINFLEAQIDSILDIAKTMEDINYKKRLMSEIHKELQGTKNVKRSNKTVGRYDYMTNKVFERLREVEAMSVEQANEIRLEIGELQEENGLKFEDKIINAFVNYKANGLTYTSTESAKAMYDDIVKMKIAGNEAKSEQDFSAKLNLANDIVEAVKILDAKTKNASLFENKYLKTLVNWESALNTLFNNKIMKKYSLLKPERDAKVFAWAKKKKFAEGVAKIYGKSVENFDEPIIENLNQKFEFHENVEDIENPGEFRKMPVNLNKMEILVFWMWDKNELDHERLLRQFGDINPDGTISDLELERMFNELSDKDKQFGDLMMRTVNGIYPLANEAFIKKYGIDLPRVQNYFPNVVERISDIDLMTEHAMKSTDPSAIKQRSKSIMIRMKPGNPVLMMFQHIDNMSRFIHMTETLDKQNKIFKNKTLQKLIESKYDKTVYQEFLRQLTANTYKQQAQNYNEDQKITDAVISNYLIANISWKPSIAIKQGITAMNYSEVMPAVQWAKGFLAAVKDAKGTIELMNKIPYLKARFETGGQNEFLEDEITNSLFAKTGKIKDALTLNIRAGDIFAIAFGGRPYLEYLMKEKGMSEADAVEEFLNHTQRTMQASETSTLANYQIKARNERGIASLVTAYRNAQAQYIRKAADAIISYTKGEMTKGQMAKTLFIYMYLNPFMYRSATSLSWVTLLATGDSDDLRDDAILSLFDLNADAHAIWGEIYQFIASVLYKKAMESATGEKPDYMDFAAKLPLVGDIQDQILKIAKDDVSFEDFFKFGGVVTAYGFGIPANSVYNTLGGFGDIAQGDFLKGALRVQGSSDRTATHAVGQDEE